MELKGSDLGFEDYELRIVIPDDAVGNLSIKTFYSGRGGNNGKALLPKDLYYQNGGQFIVINRSSKYGVKLDDKFYEKLIKKLNELGIQVEGVSKDTYSGVSLGGQNAINAFKKALKNNTSSINLNMYDPVTTQVGSLPGSFDEQEIAKMKETNSNVRLITINSRKDKWLDSGQIKKLRNNGVNVIVISGNDKDSNGLNGHEQCYKAAVGSGWEDFFDGTIELRDIKNEATYTVKNKTYTYNYDYKINIPGTDENGNIVWKEYKLADLQEQYTNFFSLSDEDQINFLEIMKYIESTRVKADFDYLSEISIVVNSANTLSNACDNDASISYTSTSTLLAEENRLIKKVFDRTSDLITDLNKTTTAVNDAKEDYTSLERRLNSNLRDLDKMV